MSSSLSLQLSNPSSAAHGHGEGPAACVCVVGESLAAGLEDKVGRQIPPTPIPWQTGPGTWLPLCEAHAAQTARVIHLGRWW